jgi:hypothetical protein
MARRSWPLLALGLLALASLAPAAGPDLAGNWKVVLLDGDNQTLWLLQLEGKGGKWSGKVLAAAENVQEATLEDLNVTDDKIAFSLKAEKKSFPFEGTIAKEAGRPVRGTLLLGGSLVPAQLEPTRLAALDTFDLNKETLAGPVNDLRYFNAGLGLLQDATEKKAKPEEVRSWAEKTFKAADQFGQRWQRDISMRIANALIPQPEHAELAVNYARRAERLVEAKDGPLTQYRVLTALANALKKAGQGTGDKAAKFAAEAKETEARLDGIDIGVKPEKFAGRKNKGDRTLLLEIFAGTGCRPCVAASLAANAVQKTYKPTDVVVIEYPVHNGGPNPLASPETDERQEYYGKAAAATPAVFISGASLDKAGGSLEEAESEYHTYRRLLDDALEKVGKEAGAQIKLDATRKGNKINVTADVSDLARTGDQIKLRLALVEDDVRYAGSNGLRVHHHIVRAMPGGPKGFALTKKTDKQVVRVDLDDLRKTLGSYLDELTKKNEVSFPQRPMDFKGLKVVAFVQNDETGEVLQAAQADVRSEKE